jgi:hypothetical protein
LEALNDYPAAVDLPDKSKVCPHCHRDAAFDLVHQVLLWPWFSTDVPPWDADERAHAPIEIRLTVFKCQGCGRASAFHEHRRRFPPQVPGGKPEIKHSSVLSLPQSRPRRLPGDGIPDAVRSFYEEGGLAEAAGAPRAAAAMFRGAVESICDALQIPRTAVNKSGREYQRSLRERVDDLATKDIDDDVVSDMHEARLVGNDSLHDGLSYSEDELADIADLIADAVQLAFVQPAERRSMREARKARREAHKIPT